MKLEICCPKLFSDIMRGDYKLSPRLYYPDENYPNATWWMVLAEGHGDDAIIKGCPHCGAKIIISVHCEEGDTLELNLNDIDNRMIT